MGSNSKPSAAAEKAEAIEATASVDCPDCKKSFSIPVSANEGACPYCGAKLAFEDVEEEQEQKDASQAAEKPAKEPKARKPLFAMPPLPFGKRKPAAEEKVAEQQEKPSEAAEKKQMKEPKARRLLFTLPFGKKKEKAEQPKEAPAEASAKPATEPKAPKAETREQKEKKESKKPMFVFPVFGTKKKEEKPKDEKPTGEKPKGKKPAESPAEGPAAAKPKMKTTRQIIMIALLVVSAALYLAGVYVSTTTTAFDKTMATFAWLVIGAVVCAIIAAPESIVSVLMLFGIYAFGAAGSLMHGVKYVEPLKEYAGYSSYGILFLILSILALAGFAAFTLLKKGCRDKSRQDVYCPGKYASWIPPVAGAALLLLFAMLSIGNWVAYQSDPGKALITLKITDYMGSHIFFEVLAALDICFIIFWVQSRKLWCKSCLAQPLEGAPVQAPQEKPRRKGFAFSFAGKKEKLVVVGTEPMKEAKKEAPAASAKAPEEKKMEPSAEKIKEKKPLFAMPSFAFGKKKEIKQEEQKPAAPEAPPVAAVAEAKKELPSGPICKSCGKEIYSVAYRCPHCSHYQEFGICTSCKQEFTVSGAPLPAEVKCEKCGDVYHVDVWKGLRPAGPACSKCGGELYFTEHPCPDCGAPKEFRICPKCGIEYSDEGYPLPPMVKCGACGRQYGIDVWKGIKQKPEYCPICGAAAKYITIVCPECGADAQSRLCITCNDLVTKCVECGAPNLFRDRNCRGCGKQFGTPFVVCQKCGLRIGNPRDHVKM